MAAETWPFRRSGANHSVDCAVAVPAAEVVIVDGFSRVDERVLSPLGKRATGTEGDDEWSSRLGFEGEKNKTVFVKAMTTAARATGKCVASAARVRVRSLGDVGGGDG